MYLYVHSVYGKACVMACGGKGNSMELVLSFYPYIGSSFVTCDFTHKATSSAPSGTFSSLLQGGGNTGFS